MSSENDFESGDEGEGVKNLRKQYDAQKKQLDELTSELNKFRAKERTSTVAEYLKAKGIPATAASLYNGDDTSEDAVGKWVETYADVFNLSTNQSKQQSPVDANLQSMQRVSNASLGNSGSADLDAIGQVLGDPEELARAMQTLPYEELVKRGYIKAG